MNVSQAVARTGFTTTELVVSMAIMGLLVAITLPAVQSARESARRLECSNNLKQFGLALASVAESHGAFPTAQLPESAYWRMLPALEQSNLLAELQALDSSPNPVLPAEMNVPQFVCPDDPLHILGYGNSNYHFNDGARLRVTSPWNGFRKNTHEDTAPQDISDGLSNTAAMSERLVGIPSFPTPSVAVMEQEPRRYFWFTAIRYNQPGQELLAIDECRHRRTTVDPQFSGSITNLYRENGRGYDHMLTPNEAGCYNGPEDLNIDTSAFLVPPSSLHAGGVNVLFADGSVHFITNGIGNDVWRALGTRNGHEPMNISF